MPRYFFDIHDGVDMIDDDGTECADLAEAQKEALKAATEILSISGHDLWFGEAWTLRVRDGSSIAAELTFTARKIADVKTVLEDAAA